MSEQLVKRFVAPTMTRALELVQLEMGPEAVILSSQRTNDGIEIVTSLEPDLPTRGIDVRREFGRNFDAELDTALPSDSAWRSQAGIEKAAARLGGHREQNVLHPASKKSSADLAQEIEAAREKMFAAKRRAEMEAKQNASPDMTSTDRSRSKGQQQSHGASQLSRKLYQQDQQTSVQNNSTTALHDVAQSSAEDAQAIQQNSRFQAIERNTQPRDEEHLHSLQNEIADMRMLLEQQLWRISESNGQMSSLSMPSQVSMPSHYSLLSERLRRLGLNDALVDDLRSRATHHNSASLAWRSCMAELSKQIPICDNSISDVPGIYAFLGQTGVGKTTTIAKIAAQYVLKHGAGKVALVTTDTYRVGAFDQLRTMGRILNVPVKVVDQENSLLTVLSSLRQFPLVLIDTAGFRIGDPLLKTQLEQLESSPSIKRVLVLSCNSQLATMKAAVHAHRGKRGLAATVLTKIDESASIGEAISVVVGEQLPVAYTTDGQDIPKDIAKASGHALVAKAVAVLKAQNAMPCTASV